jgi:hypothetical protein
MKTTKRIKNALLITTIIAMLGVFALPSATLRTAPAAAAEAVTLSAAPVAYWSREAQRAIVPAGPGGIFGPDNYGNKFAGDAEVYMAIVHIALYDTALAFQSGYRPYAISLTAPAGASPEAAIATAAHNTLVGMQPDLGLTTSQQSILDGRYADYLAAIPNSTAKTDGIAVGAQVATAVLALRANDGRASNPQYGQAPFVPPSPGPGVWDPGTSPAVGLRLPGMRPFALQSASQFRPDGPDALASSAYAEDFQQVKDLGRLDSATRTQEQTTMALFWTDHNTRQWNDGMLGLAASRNLDLAQTARMLAMSHVAQGDAAIACFEAKYHYWFWRPYQAIPRADTDGNPATEADTTWRPLRTTPNFPEYPSGHACLTSAAVEALQAFYGTDKISFSLDSRITNTTSTFKHLHEPVQEVNRARVLVGFHFRSSTQEGTNLGRHVSRYVTDNLFQPVR